VKLLLDSCVWGGTATRLRAAGHDVVWSGDWPADPGDEEILALAFAEGRVLVTLDKDFGELAIGRGLPNAGILRLVGLSAPQQAEVTLRVIATWPQEPSSPRGRIASGSAFRRARFAGTCDASVTDASGSPSRPRRALRPRA
jgi:predicted nuclease of predicted toxin-antitoxin system